MPGAAFSTTDDRVWRSGARMLVGVAGFIGLAGAPSVPTGGAAAGVVAAYGALALLVPDFGGVLRPAPATSDAELESGPPATPPRPGRKLPRNFVVGVDLAVLALGAVLLLSLDLVTLSLLAAPALVAAHAYEDGASRARAIAIGVTAGMALLVAVGPGPPPTWRDGAAVAFAGALAALTAHVGASIGAAHAVVVEDRASIAELRQAIITTVSHELRTPLTIIQGITWALESRWDQLAETNKLDLIDTLALNIASLDASILHFLDAGRLVKGQWEIRPGWVDPVSLVSRVTTKLGPVLAGHDVQDRIETDRIWGDDDALLRVLELLLVNACRFSPPASPIGVRVSGSPAGGWELSVVDRGQGIPPKDLPHVFEPLWRADVQESGVSRGAGLGLAIVAELAERHGGRVTVSSTRGRGSTFRLALPPAPAGT